jgi:hypothetical protein
VAASMPRQSLAGQSERKHAGIVGTDRALAGHAGPADAVRPAAEGIEHPARGDCDLLLHLSEISGCSAGLLDRGEAVEDGLIAELRLAARRDRLASAATSRATSESRSAQPAGRPTRRRLGMLASGPRP